MREYYKENYSIEFDNKEKIDSKLYVLISIISILAGATFILLKDYEKIIEPYNLVFKISGGILIFLLIITFYYLCRAFLGYRYKYTQDPETMKNFYNGWLEYYSDKRDAEKRATDKVMNFLDKVYAECATENRNLNIKKAAFARKCIMSTIGAVIMLSITGIFYLNGFSDDNEIDKIEIINVEKHKIHSHDID